MVERRDQLLPVSLVSGVLGVAVVQILEERGGLDRVPGAVLDAVRDDEQILGVLVEELVRLGVERVHRRLPDDLVDPGDGAVGEPDEEDVELETLATSIAPVKGIESRGWILKPSSVLSTSMSAQSEGRTVQLGLGGRPARP